MRRMTRDRDGVSQEESAFRVQSGGGCAGAAAGRAGRQASHLGCADSHSLTLTQHSLSVAIVRPGGSALLSASAYGCARGAEPWIGGFS